MKTAITSEGNSVDALMDRHFGRCSFFVIYDDTSHSVEFLPNPNRGNLENAGPESVALLKSKKVDKVVSGEFGLKAKALFDIHKIQLVIISGTKKISEIISILEKAK
jgi:predicted Fe-Mo cluster-binding NifX family protein